MRNENEMKLIQDAVSEAASRSISGFSLTEKPE